MNPPGVSSSHSELLRPERIGTASSEVAGDPAEPLPGIVCSQFIQCGKPNCRCRKGMPHGPYFYRIWRDGRTVKKVYVRAQDVARVRGQCERYGVLDEELRALRARRLAYTARLWTQIRRSRRLREEPPKQGRGLGPP